MTAKLLWYPGPTSYRLEVFMGPNTRKRRYAGELTFTPAEAAWFRSTVLLDQLGTLDVDVRELGWIDPIGAAA
jgi:hypothetical protein